MAKRNEDKPRIYSVTGERVKELLKREGISQRELKRRLIGAESRAEVNTGDICAIVGGYKELTSKMAKRIIGLFPEKHYRIAWLLGYDNNGMTEEEVKQADLNDYFEKSLKEAEEDGIMFNAFFDLMKLLKVEFIKTDTDPFSMSDPLPPVARYEGHAFNSIELYRIMVKTCEILKIELDHAAMEKEGDFSIKGILSATKSIISMKHTMELLQKRAEAENK